MFLSDFELPLTADESEEADEGMRRWKPSDQSIPKVADQVILQATVMLLDYLVELWFWLRWVFICPRPAYFDRDLPL